METFHPSNHRELDSYWEGIYLDQGGCLTPEQRDQAFGQAMKLLKEAELKIQFLENLAERHRRRAEEEITRSTGWSEYMRSVTPM